ncbi:MAG TPA: Fur family transcriptional regulator [Stellaceae bacterium]|nr:Fur family transcriptional regulator [Stellaceae bacterium]
MTNRLERICLERGLRMNEKRRVILRVLDKAQDHPCVDEVYRRVTESDPRISISTVYRTLKILAQAGVLSRVEFGDGRAHYEEARDDRHEHLIDIDTGKVLEFRNGAIETVLREAAGQLGYRLLQYRLELFAALEATADGFGELHVRERD